MYKFRSWSSFQSCQAIVMFLIKFWCSLRRSLYIYTHTYETKQFCYGFVNKYVLSCVTVDVAVASHSIFEYCNWGNEWKKCYRTNDRLTFLGSVVRLRVVTPSFRCMNNSRKPQTAGCHELPIPQSVQGEVEQCKLCKICVQFISTNKLFLFFVFYLTFYVKQIWRFLGRAWLCFFVYVFILFIYF